MPQRPKLAQRQIEQWLYAFLQGPGWEEIPVSIADLGGTEIDLRCVAVESFPPAEAPCRSRWPHFANGRFRNTDMGDVAVVVAPVLRIRDDFGFGANVSIENVGTPEQIISGFGLEIFGERWAGVTHRLQLVRANLCQVSLARH